MNLDLNLIMYFVAVAEERSFRRAADRLNIAQPWMSRQVKKLESHLGFDLFRRTTRTVELTEKGQRLLERAQMLARDAHLTKALAESLRRERPDGLSFGLPLYAVYVDEREKLFERFGEKYPTVRLDLRMGPVKGHLPELLNGNIDIVFMAGQPEEAGLETITLVEGPIDILMPVADPLAKKDVVSFADIAGRELVTFQRSTSVGLFDDLFGVFENKRIKLVEYPNYGFTRRVEEIQGLTALPSWVKIMREGVVRRPLQSDHMVKLRIARRLEAPSSTLAKFWQVAKDMSLQVANPRNNPNPTKSIISRI